MSRGRGADVGRVYSVGQLRIDIIEIRWTGIAEQRQGRGREVADQAGQSALPLSFSNFR